MGGLLIITAIVVPTLLWVNLANPLVWIAVGAVLVFGLIGFLDDYLKVVMKRNLGLRAGAKFALQILVAGLVGGCLLAMSSAGLWDTRLQVPFFKTLTPDLGLLYVPFAVIVIVGSANAVNLTTASTDWRSDRR